VADEQATKYLKIINFQVATCFTVFQNHFKTNSKEIINNCELYFGLPPIADAIKNVKLTS